MSDFTSSLSFLTENPAAAAIKDAYTSFSERRALLNLPNPGTVDNIAREVQKEVLLSNFMFTGLRADLTKVFGMTPLFRVSHAFSMGSSGNLPPYAFSAMYGSPKVCHRSSSYSKVFLLVRLNCSLGFIFATGLHAR
jgi:mitochondrial import receptor subunit TOM40